MAIFKCAGRKRFDSDGDPICEHESTVRWIGRCPSCQQYYDVEKFGAERTGISRTSAANLSTKETVYVSTGSKEVDKVLGGGIVAGSTVLFGGSRGCGKSSLLMKVADGVASKAHPVLYASGEENVDDVGKICHRLGVKNEHLEIMGNATDIEEIIARAEEVLPTLIIFDSLQVMTCSDMKGNEGSSSQGLAVANVITGFCKRTKTSAIIVNHVNKLGEFTGSTSVEHLVDTLMMLERDYTLDKDGEIDEDSTNLRMLISDKNRNGAEGVKAYFEMTDTGLKPIRGKSKLSLV